MYKQKYTSDSALPKYKGRIVAKSFKQEQGVDLNEIFSPVVQMTMLHMMLTFVAKKDLDLFQMDVKTIFMHRDLDEEIYTEQPKGL